MRIPALVTLAVLAAPLLPGAADAQDTSVYYISGAALVAVLPGFLLDLHQPDSERAFLRASGGRFDVIDDENQAYDFLVEFQPPWTWNRIKPLFGVAGNSDGSVYGWISAAHDFHFAKVLVINVNTGPAFYVVGEEAKNLGSPAVLRSGFEVGFRLPRQARLTASFHHMSHGKLMNRDWNPGTEVIAVNLSLPVN